nr:EOG090X0KOU [Eurycercus lamellatus]
MERPKKSVFVTVGTTSFDVLINRVLHPETLDVLEKQCFTHIMLQIGRGLKPDIPDNRKIEVSWYSFKDNILHDMESASLIISHAGAGSCLESLNVGKPLIVVVNDTLMGNHQHELADKLHSEGYVNMCYPNNLPTVLENSSLACFKPFPRSDNQLFSNYVEKLMGFSD